jgi:hypothetical protein
MPGPALARNERRREPSGANLTFAPHPASSLVANVKFKSSTRINKFLVVLMILTFALVAASVGSKCQNRTTSIHCHRFCAAVSTLSSSAIMDPKQPPAAVFGVTRMRCKNQPSSAPL